MNQDDTIPRRTFLRQTTAAGIVLAASAIPAESGPVSAQAADAKTLDAGAGIDLGP